MTVRKIGLVTTLLLLSYAASVAQQKQPPNIIFILADDLGVGDLGVYGQQKIATPHLDQLAKEGMMMSQFYTGSPVCAPSRATLMTGLHTGHAPIRGNKATPPEGQWPLPQNSLTIAEVLKDAGYATGDFGKWGMGFVGTTGDPNKQGFDAFYGYNCQSLAHNYFPDYLWQNDKKIKLQNTSQQQNDYAADLIQNQAQQFIKDHSRKPFFLFLSYTLPHAALQLPENDSLFTYYRKLFNEKPVPVPPNWTGKGYQPQAYPHAAYAAMVGKLDAYVGQIKAEIEQLGLGSNTIILFASDNGPHAEGGNDPEFFNSSGGLKGIKRDLYEGGIRTPLIAWWPGRIRAGSQSAYVGAFWDLLPTFAELAGADQPTGVDGISFVPELLGKSPQKKHTYLYWEFHEQGGKQAVRLDNWKGVRLGVMENPDAAIELYNLVNDPSEQNNIAAAHPDIVKKIAAIMKDAHVENEDFPFLPAK
ncbi:arylsulfatase [Niabella insulamsoli]|uniref:arylsulfatase n=1 Tax=Niabella insulamsoli TaxID=3144874 RepID=UPI0031FD23A2